MPKGGDFETLSPTLSFKSGRRTAAVQDASRDLAPRKFRQVLDCGCPSAAFGAADLVTDTFNRTLSLPAHCKFRRSPLRICHAGLSDNCELQLVVCGTGNLSGHARGYRRRTALG